MVVKVGVYSRISLDAEGLALGVQRQQADCEQLAKLRGWEIGDTYVDNNISAYKDVERPEFKRLLDDLRAGRIDGIVAYDLDRISRRPKQLEEIIEIYEQRHGLKFATVQGDIDLSSSDGLTMARVMVAFANKSSRDTSRRQKRKNLERAQAGLPHGSRRPFGYEADLVTVRHSEASVLKEMASRLLLGHSYKEIARWANAQGHVTSEGRSFATLTVRHLLTNIRYASIREYNGERHKGAWEPIFDAETWQRLEASTRARSQPAPGPVARKYLLTGLLYCGKCGQPLAGGQRRQNGVMTRAYWCRTNTYVDESRRGCGGIRRGADALDAFVTDCLFYRLDTPELGKLLSVGDPGDTALSDLLTDRQSQQRRKDGLLDQLTRGVLTEAEFVTAKGMADAELHRIDDEIERLNRERIKLDVPLGESLRSVWNSSDSDEWRRSLLRLMIKRIDVLPSSMRRVFYKQWLFNPDEVEIEFSA